LEVLIAWWWIDSPLLLNRDTLFFQWLARLLASASGT
jgi:hypothetical protein